ncbi:hypothetical protein V866_006438 [Kwoniella sp. B9012]|uniref:Uncharacterized protein n=1 Tax=Kwoniella europaea PYCC6329 TaxID=1423913 RepID=A0AAX4KU34_9TREE
MSQGYVPEWTSDPKAIRSETTNEIVRPFILKNEADHNLYRYLLTGKGVREVARFQVSADVAWHIARILEGTDRELTLTGTFQISFGKTSAFLGELAFIGQYVPTWFRLYYQDDELEISSISQNLHRIFSLLTEATTNLRDEKQLRGVYVELFHLVFYENEETKSFDINSNVKTSFRIVDELHLRPLALNETDLQIGFAPDAFRISKNQYSEPVKLSPSVYALSRDILVNSNDDLFESWFPYVLVHLNTGTSDFNKTRLENDTSILLALKLYHALYPQAIQTDPVHCELHISETRCVFGIRVLADWVEVVMGFLTGGKVLVVPIFASPISILSKYLQFVNILLNIKDERDIRKSIIENWLWCSSGRLSEILLLRLARNRSSASTALQRYFYSPGPASRTPTESPEEIDKKNRINKWLEDIHDHRHSVERGYLLNL